MVVIARTTGNEAAHKLGQVLSVQARCVLDDDSVEATIVRVITVGDSSLGVLHQDGLAELMDARRAQKISMQRHRRS